MRVGARAALAGGFARYSVDADWVVPHFEKMLYDNALLLRVYAEWAHTISGLCVAGTRLGMPEYVEAAVAAGELLHRVHTVDGRLRRVSRDGVVGTPAGILEDYACVAAGFLELVQATGDPVWLERAGALLDVALDRFGDEDGGFHDTADDAEQLVARPRDPSDNASPSGLSSMVHALVTYAALTGSGRHRDAAEAALSTVAAIAQRAPPIRRLAAASRRRLGAVVLVADGPRDDVPLLVGRTAVDGRPAAYVCRGFVCERPVTDPDLLPV